MAVAAHIRKTGSLVIQYFDDWLLHSASYPINSQSNISLANNTNIRSYPKYRKVGTNTDSDLHICRDVLPQSGIVSVLPDQVDALMILVRSVLPREHISARGFLPLLEVLNTAADFTAGQATHETNVTGSLIRIHTTCLLYTSPSPRDLSTSRMPSSA